MTLHVFGPAMWETQINEKAPEMTQHENTWKTWGKILKYDLMMKLQNALTFTPTVNDQLPVVAKLCSFFTFT